MRKVYSADNSLLAGHVKSLLEQAGIECLLKNQILSGAMGELPLNECWPEVWVCDDRDYGAALEVIESALAPGTASGEPWRCACGETIENQFTACWHCGGERPK